MAYSTFYEDLADLDKVDWKVMKSKWWNDTVDDMDRKRRRQAEFLVHDFFPWELITRIGVIDNGMAQQVNEILKRAARSGGRPGWCQRAGNRRTNGLLWPNETVRGGFRSFG